MTSFKDIIKYTLNIIVSLSIFCLPIAFSENESLILVSATVGLVLLSNVISSLARKLLLDAEDQRTLRFTGDGLPFVLAYYSKIKGD